MRKLAWAVCAVSLCILFGAACAAEPYRVLLVDGTKTLEATLRVGGLVKAIRQSGLAEVSVAFTDEESPYADPLAGKLAPALPYDIIIIVPRGIGDGTSNVVWLLVGGSPFASPAASAALAALGSGMNLVFGEGIRGLGPLDDLWATLTAALYVTEGWLH